MDEAPVMERLLQCVENEARCGRQAGAPADDPSGIDVDDEGDINETAPGDNVCKILSANCTATQPGA
jgi:hypothetical protein